jgi:FixJ family two-component response regulator
VTNTDAYIAVVDDDKSVRKTLDRILRLDGYDVSSFDSTDTFLASLASRIPACVIVDVHMPGPSGFEAQARARMMGFDVPAVFITASDDRTLDDAVREARGAALLRKPFTSDALLRAVSTALRDRGRD